MRYPIFTMFYLIKKMLINGLVCLTQQYAI